MRIFEERAYQYQKHLSTGGEGEIHLIRRGNQTFVAKIVPALDATARRLLEDIRCMAIPNTPKIHEIFDVEGKTVIIRDYIEGNTLYEEIKKNGSLTLARAIAVMRKICDTLRALHAVKPNPIIYRDLKPENVIIMPDGDVRLIDFGIVRYYRQEATRDTVIAGTAGYTAPEVMAGVQSDERSDVYSAGLLFYEMLTGLSIAEPPYQVRPVCEANALLPAWVDTVVVKATDISPANRYRSITAFFDCLEHPEKLAAPKKKKGWMAAVALVAILLLSGAWYGYENYVRAKNYEMMISIDFDTDADQLWVIGYENGLPHVTFSDGRLNLLRDGCNIDFTPKPGMVVHYRASMPRRGTVGLSQYRVNGNMTFECLYYNEGDRRTYGTGDLPLEGLLFKNTGQFIDFIFYIAPDDGAVYIILADEQAGRISYAARKIPGIMQNRTLYMELNNFSAEGSVILDGVYVAEGSLQGYLQDHLQSYRSHRERVDAFLAQSIETIPAISIPW